MYPPLQCELPDVPNMLTLGNGLQRTVTQRQGIWKILSCLIICAVDDFSLIMPPVFSKVVDIFNVTSGTWSTANLSEARFDLTSTSLPNAGIAFFAGGRGTLCDDIFLLRLQGGS